MYNNLLINIVINNKHIIVININDTQQNNTRVKYNKK